MLDLLGKTSTYGGLLMGHRIQLMGEFPKFSNAAMFSQGSLKKVRVNLLGKL